MDEAISKAKTKSVQKIEPIKEEKRENEDDK